MVTPKLSILTELDSAVSRQAEVLRGLIQQARLVSFDELAGVGCVRVYGRLGQTARVDNVLALDSASVAGLVGFDCLILSPNGRPSDGSWIIGGASGPSLLYPGIGLARTTTTTASTTSAGDEVEAWRVRFEAPPDGGALLVTAFEAPVALASVNTRPVLTAFGGGGTSRRYVPRTLPLERDAYTQTGATVVLTPESEPFRLDAAASFQVAAVAERIDLSQDASWQFYTTGGKSEAGRLTVAGVAPALRVRGRLAVALV